MSIGGIRPDAAALSGLREDSAELERARTTREAADKFETYLASCRRRRRLPSPRDAEDRA